MTQNQKLEDGFKAKCEELADKYGCDGETVKNQELTMVLEGGFDTKISTHGIEYTVKNLREVFYLKGTDEIQSLGKHKIIVTKDNKTVFDEWFPEKPSEVVLKNGEKIFLV